MRRIPVLAATAAFALIGMSCNPDVGSVFPMTIGSVGNVKMHYEGEYQGYSQVYNQELTSATIK